MSTERGNGSRTRAQKYKNRTVFKNDLYDKTQKQKQLNSMNISSVCQHCKGVIEWKIKYKKYKPLSQAKTCTRCQERKVNKAYHVICRDCAVKSRSCAKCLKTADQVDIEPPGPTPQEEQKLKVEMDRLIKALPERKRRAFQRFMDKGKKQEEDEDDKKEEDEANKDKNDETENQEAVQTKPLRIPHTRDELLQKIEQLKLKADDDGDLEDDSDDYEDSEEEENEESC